MGENEKKGTKRTFVNRQLQYYMEYEAEKSPILKSMDPYRQELPIGYAKNCTRKLDYEQSTRNMDGVLGFGKIHANLANIDILEENMQFYRSMVLCDLLANVYSEKGAKGHNGECDGSTEAYLQDRPWLVNEWLRRFYPSDANWMMSDGGEGYNNGKILDPINHSYQVADLVSEDSGYRNWMFNAEHPSYFKRMFIDFLNKNNLESPYPLGEVKQPKTKK